MLILNAIILMGWLVYTAIEVPNHLLDMAGVSLSALAVGLNIGVKYE